MVKRTNATLVFFLCYFSYAAAYICRLNFSVAAPSMVSSGMLSSAQIGFISSAFFCTYSVGQLVNGFMGDKFNPAVMITAALAIAGITNIFIGLSHSFFTVMLLWGINGYGQSILWGPMLRGLSATVEEKKRVKMVMLLISCAPLGSIAGIIIGSSFTGLEYKFAFYIPGIIILFMSILNLVLLRMKKTTEIPQKLDIIKIFSDNKIRSELLPAIFHGVIKDNLNVWLPLYFVGVFEIDVKHTALYVFMMPITGLFGRIIYPYIYSIAGNTESKVSAVFFFVCAACAIPLAINGISPLVAIILLCIISIGINIINTSFLSVFPMRFVSSGTVSSVAGIMDFATYMGAAVSSFIYGIIIDIFGFPAMFISWAVLSAVSIITLTVRKQNT